MNHIDEHEEYLAVRNGVGKALVERMEGPLTGDHVQAIDVASIQIASHISAWRLDRNPYHVDLFLTACRRFGIAPPSAASDAITEVAMLRIEDRLPPGSRSQVVRDIALERAYMLMMNLKFHGATMPEAASKAARWLNDYYPGLKPTPYKASGMQRQYEKGWGKAGHEKTLARLWKLEPSEQARQFWLHLRDILPDSEEENIGNRRD